MVAVSYVVKNAVSYVIKNAVSWFYMSVVISSGVPRGVLGVPTPPPEIPKALQNRTKLNPIVKTVKNSCI